MNTSLTEKQESNILHYFGIGAFSILTLFELCGFLGDILKDTLIIFVQNPKTIYILSVLTSLVTFTIMLLLLVKKIKTSFRNNSRKLLIIAIVCLFATWCLIICYNQFISDYLVSKFSNNYNVYNAFWKGKYLLRGYLSIVSVLYYVILAFAVLKKENYS